MRIGKPPAPVPDLRLNPAPTALRGLRPGQSLPVTVQQDGRGLFIELGGQRLDLPQHPGLRQGVRLQLLVQQLEPRPAVKLSPPADAAAATLRQAILRLVPEPAARRPLTQPLSSILGSTAPPAARPALPAAVSAAVAHLDQALPRPAQLQSPHGLRQALLGSGLFAEANLLAQGGSGAGAATTLQTDLKLLALRLWASAVQRGPAETTAPRPAGGSSTATEAPGAPLLATLRSAGEALVSRIQLLQVHNAGAESGRLDLAVELPVRADDQGLELFQLRLRREDAPEREAEADGGGGSGHEPLLQVQLAFEFTGLGALQATLRLRGHRIDADWWAEQPQTAALLRDSAPELQGRLEALGLTVAGLRIQRQRPPGPLEDLIRPSRGMLDEKA